MKSLIQTFIPLFNGISYCIKRIFLTLICSVSEKGVVPEEDTEKRNDLLVTSTDV